MLLAFLLNHQVLNEKFLMRVLVFIGNFSYGFGLKNWAFYQHPQRKNGIQLFFSASHSPCEGKHTTRECQKRRFCSMFCTPRAHGGIPGACGFSSQYVFAFSSSFLVFSSSGLVQGLGTKFPELVISCTPHEYSFHIFPFFMKCLCKIT